MDHQTIKLKYISNSSQAFIKGLPCAKLQRWNRFYLWPQELCFPKCCRSCTPAWPPLVCFFKCRILDQAPVQWVRISGQVLALFFSYFSIWTLHFNRFSGWFLCLEIRGSEPHSLQITCFYSVNCWYLFFFCWLFLHGSCWVDLLIYFLDCWIIFCFQNFSPF